MEHAMRRKERAVSAEVAQEWIAKAQSCIVSMIAREGTPYAVPVNHVMLGDCIYFHCANVGRKLDCLQHNPNVCMSFVSAERVVAEHYTTQYESVLV